MSQHVFTNYVFCGSVNVDQAEKKEKKKKLETTEHDDDDDGDELQSRKKNIIVCLVFMHDERWDSSTEFLNFSPSDN